jgi:hypothetical protein
MNDIALYIADNLGRIRKKEFLFGPDWPIADCV